MLPAMRWSAIVVLALLGACERKAEERKEPAAAPVVAPAAGAAEREDGPEAAAEAAAATGTETKTERWREPTAVEAQRQVIREADSEVALAEEAVAKARTVEQKKEAMRRLGRAKLEADRARRRMAELYRGEPPKP